MGVLEIVTVLLVLLGQALKCQGRLVAIVSEDEQDSRYEVERLGQGEVVIDKVTVFHPELGSKVRDGQKLRALFLSPNDTKMVCNWLEGGDIGIDKMGLNLTGIDMIISNWDNRRCQMRNFDRVCLLASIVIGVDKARYPGTASTGVYDWSNALKEKVKFCSFLEGKLLREDLFELEQSLAFRAEITMDEPETYNIYRSFAVQFVFRVVVPIYYSYVAYKSVQIFLERKRRNRHVLGSHMFILGLNTAQGVAFAILNAIGLHTFGNTFSEFFVVATFSNLFSLSTATDLIFARLLSDIYRGLKQRKRYAQTGATKWLMVALCIISVEIGTFGVYIANPIPRNYMITTKIMPGALMLLSLCITAYVVYLMRQVASALLSAYTMDDNIVMNPQMVARQTAQLNLAKQYHFWTKISILSVCLIYLAALLSLLGFMHKTPGLYLTIVFGLDFGKLLNMHAQTRCCQIPKGDLKATRSVLSTKITHSRETSNMLNYNTQVDR